MKLLIVDDEPVMRKGLLYFIDWEALDCVIVSEAKNGFEAKEYIESNPVDIVIADIRMPGMDGISLLRFVHERDPDLAVVLVTGGPAVETAVEALELGALHYLSKPVDREKFERTIEHAIAFSRNAHARRHALEALGVDLRQGFLLARPGRPFPTFRW